MELADAARCWKLPFLRKSPGLGRGTLNFARTIFRSRYLHSLRTIRKFAYSRYILYFIFMELDSTVRFYMEYSLMDRAKRWDCWFDVHFEILTFGALGHDLCPNVLNVVRNLCVWCILYIIKNDDEWRGRLYDYAITIRFVDDGEEKIRMRGRDTRASLRDQSHSRRSSNPSDSVLLYTVQRMYQGSVLQCYKSFAKFLSYFFFRHHFPGIYSNFFPTSWECTLVWTRTKLTPAIGKSLKF